MIGKEKNNNNKKTYANGTSIFANLGLVRTVKLACDVTVFCANDNLRAWSLFPDSVEGKSHSFALIFTLIFSLAYES